MRKQFYILSLLLIFGAVLMSACSGGVAAAQAQVSPVPEPAASQPARTISVTGTGKAVLTPDIAYIYLGVHTENANATQAVSGNNTQATAVKDALTKAGVAAKDIQTSNFSISPQQQYDKDGKLTGILYVVDNTVFVTVRDLAKIGDLLDAVVKAGANNVNSIQFDVADRTAALSQARKAAMTDAHSQASELAQAAGVTLGDVQTISVSSLPTPVPVYMAASKAALDSAPSVPVSPGELTITLDVSVVYTIK